MAASATNFTIQITALDRASAVFRTVNRNLSGLTSPLRGLSRSLANLGEEIGINKVVSAAEHAGHKLAHVGGQIREAFAPLAILGIGAGAAGLFELAKSAGEWGSELYVASQRTGVAADQLAKLRYVGSTLRIGPEQMDLALQNLNRTIGQVATGKNKDAAGWLRAMHVNIWQKPGQLKSNLALLSEMSDHFSRNASTAIKSTAAQALMRKGWTYMLPLLDMGSKKIRELFGAFDKAFGPMSPEMFKAAHEYEEQMGRLQLATQGLRVSIGNALMPVLSPLIGRLTQWIEANRGLITQKVKEWVDRIGNALAQIDWKRISDTVMGFGSAIGRVLSFLGPTWGTLAVAGVVFSPFIASTLGATLALAGLAKELFLVGLRLGLVPFAGLARSIGLVLPEIKSLRDAWVALDLVMDANPIGVMVLAAAAFAGTGYLVYKNWSSVSGVLAPIAGKLGINLKDVSTSFRNTFDRKSLDAFTSSLGSMGQSLSHVAAEAGPLASVLSEIATTLGGIVGKQMLLSFGIDLDKLSPSLKTFGRALGGDTNAQLQVFAKAMQAAAFAVQQLANGMKFLRTYLPGMIGKGIDLGAMGRDIGQLAMGKAPKGFKPRASVEDPGGVWDPSTWGDFGRASRAQQAMAFFSKRFSKMQAAAIVGNLSWESGGLNPTKYGDGGSAYGAAQWHRARAAIFARVMHRPLQGSSLEDQYRFVAYELTKGQFKRVGDMLRQAKSLNEATGIINRGYERPASPAASQGNRLALAQRFFDDDGGSLNARPQQGGHVKAHIKVDVKAPPDTRVSSRASGTIPHTLETGRNAW